MSNASPRSVVPAALAAVLAAGAWPYVYMLRLWPTSRDAALWISRSALDNPAWTEWVFRTRHFNVGYRPVTGLSYTLDWLVGGYAALPYRLTDLGIHLLCAALVYALYRRVAPTLPRWGGILSAFLFLAHPLVDQVVPHLARRSYSLATALGLAALLVLYPAAGANSSTRRGVLKGLAGGLLLALALLSNETAVAFVLALPLFVLHAVYDERNRLKPVLFSCGIPAAMITATLVVRQAVVAGMGGYTPQANAAERVLPIVAATWQALIGILPSPEMAGRGPSPILLGCWIAVGAFYLWQMVIEPLRGFGDSQRRLRLVPLLWLFALTALYAPLGVWFPRQVYVALVPFSLGLGLLAADTIARRKETGWPLVARLVPQVFVVGWILVQSPVLLGSDPARVLCWRGTDRVMRDMIGDIEQLQAPADVHFAIPFYKRPGVFALRARERKAAVPLASRAPEIWARTVLRGREMSVNMTLLFEIDPLAPAAALPSLSTDRKPQLSLPSDVTYLPRLDGAAATPEGEPIVRPVDTLVRAAGQSTYFYFHDGNRGNMVHMREQAASP